jgi:hypothetical protein
MATFVARGLLRFDALVPDELNGACMDELADPRSPARTRYQAGQRLDTCFTDSSGVGAVFRLPAVRGIIASLVGPRAAYDHHVVHIREAGQPGQPLHADEIIDTRLCFDIQIMYFPHEVTPDGGGTFLLPGSHFRRVNDQDIGRYKNFAGQEFFSGPAGSIVVVHHGIWHCGRPNRSDDRRYMFKVRINPRVDQVRLWDTSDLESPEIRQTISQIFAKPEPWFEQPTGLLEQVNRVVLWRHLTGDDSFDVHHRVSRLAEPSLPRLLDYLP